MSEELSLKGIQECTLKVLKYIDAVCKDNKLDYFLMYGTLIGAARHEGFIPWDDDIDIMMPRKDYNELLRILNSEDSSDYKLFHGSFIQDYPYSIARVCDVNTKLEVQDEKDYGGGLFLDIYPLDDISNTYNMAVFKGYIFGFLSSLCFWRSRTGFTSSYKGVKKAFNFMLYSVSRLIPHKLLLKMLDQSKRQGDLRKKYVGCLEWMTIRSTRNVFLREDFLGRDKLKFEDSEFFVPKKYDTVLRKFYGDYQKLPPEEQRVPHHRYKAFIKES